MKNLKYVLSFALMTLFVGMSFGQSAKLQQRATDKVEELNTLLTSQDETAALTEEQQTSMQELYLELFSNIREINKGEGTEEEKTAQVRAARKALSQQVNQEILTKAQRQVKRAAKATSDQ